MGVTLSREKREEILTILVKIYCEQEGLELESLEFEEVEEVKEIEEVEIQKDKTA